ncbi:MAG: (2Fe-2S)-binding protein, partial [Gammaproteobacteria bacterium]|nr:(2Fe-2S)-binding protein [Gammaproteobacteria bacterium]
MSTHDAAATEAPPIVLTVNDQRHQLQVAADRSLLDVLRNDLGLRASHFGCGSGECGACMVLLDGHPVPSCDTPMWSVSGKTVRTSEGLGSRAAPHPIQTAFIATQAVQCGYCTSGMLISAAALLEQHPRPTDSEMRQGLERNLCRCGTHPRVMRAIEQVAEA